MKKTKSPRQQRKQLLQDKRLAQVRADNLEERWQKAGADYEAFHAKGCDLIPRDPNVLKGDRELSLRCLQHIHDELHMIADLEDMAVSAGDTSAVQACGLAAAACASLGLKLVQWHGFKDEDIACDRPEEPTPW